MPKRRSIKEMLWRTEPWTSFTSSLRQSWSALTRTLYEAPTNSSLRGTHISREQARVLYYNLDTNISKGAHFAKPIIDGPSDFIGVPSFNTGNDDADKHLRTTLEQFWSSCLREIYRITMRDSDCWARLRGMPAGPLRAENEVGMTYLEPIISDRVTPHYDPFTNELVKVEVSNIVFIADTDQNISITSLNEPVIISSNISGREHEIIEVITASQFRYFDVTEQIELDNLRTTNEWGFVPFVHLYNEYDSSLEGGISDLENVYPFLIAHSELFKQTQQSHKLHATPKLKFKIDDVMTFIQNNFPDSIIDGEFTGKITWTGKEVLFLESAEDAEYLEVNSGLDNSVNLLEFVIDCIAIASERPEWIFMRTQVGQNIAASNAQTLPFKNLVGRKRAMLAEPLLELTKMALAVGDKTIIRAEISWPEIETADLVVYSTALQNQVTASEVANRSGIIDRSTYRDSIKRYYPTMKDNAAEEASAQKELQAEAQQTLEQEKALQAAKAAAAPNKNAASGNGNGTGPNSSRNRLPVTVVPPGD